MDLVFVHLPIHRQRGPARGKGLGAREVTGPISQTGEAGLDLEQDQIMHDGRNPLQLLF
jgi:hypothetical protein